MNRIVIFLVCVGLLTASISFTASSSAEEHEREKGKGKGLGRGPSIESIMKTVHGKRGLMKSLETMLEEKQVNWADVQAITKKIAPLAADLGKRKPDKGTKVSWAELTEIYADYAKELDAAAAKKDLVAAKDSFTELNSSCNKCHSRHKGGR